jgi:hypothetical protein
MRSYHEIMTSYCVFRVILGESCFLDCFPLLLDANFFLITCDVCFEDRLPLAHWDQQFDRLQLVASQHEA